MWRHDVTQLKKVLKQFIHFHGTLLMNDSNEPVFNYLLFAWIVPEPPMSSNPVDQFHWLPKEHMCVLVYLVSNSFEEILQLFSKLLE